jgi:hypothetical protein
MPSRDGILLLQSDLETSELSFLLFLNWRTADPKTPKCSVAPPPARPSNWRFEPSGTGFLAFALGSFRPGSKPSAAIHENSIVLVSESAAIFWDIVDRPVLRFLLCLPPPPIRPIFSFLGNRFAIITHGTVLIVRAVSGPRTRADEAFSPGSKCFELHETLVPWFGVTQDNVNASSLFIVRHLPNRPVAIEILFEWRPPGEPIQVQFVSPTNALLLLTTLGVFACRPATPEALTYSAMPLSSFHSASQVHSNKNFLILRNNESLYFFPNPEKTALNFDDSFFELEKITFRNIMFVTNNDDYCVIVTASVAQKAGPKRADIEEAAVYVLQYEDCQTLTHRLLGSSNLLAQKAGLRLKNLSDPDFPQQLFDVGMRLVKATPPELSNGVLALVQAFNSRISEPQRQSILSEVMKIRRQAVKLAFIREAHFRSEEITADVQKLILSLPPAQAIRKLIQSKKFEAVSSPGDIPEARLYTAIGSALRGEHDLARGQFASVPVDLFEILDDDLLSKISDDLMPQVLVAIEKPDLHNGQWSVAERRAACYYNRGELLGALEIAADNIDANWHFSEWPKVPELCDWVEGNEMMQFAAGCCTYHVVVERVPAVFARIHRAASLAKEGQFKDALEVLGAALYKFEFLRCFAKEPAKWAVIIEQVEDPDVRRCAFHYLIASSPKKSYKSVVGRLTTRPEIRKIADELEAVDLELLKKISGAPRRHISDIH